MCQRFVARQRMGSSLAVLMIRRLNGHAFDLEDAVSLLQPAGPTPSIGTLTGKGRAMIGGPSRREAEAVFQSALVSVTEVFFSSRRASEMIFVRRPRGRQAILSRSGAVT